MRTGAAFAAVTLLGQALFSADASAQSSERRLIDEIVRTAETRAEERILRPYRTAAG
jgi:hypothetical protein